MQADIGIIGGSGFYSFLSDIERVDVDTPFGAPSAPLAIGEVNGRRVAFVPRHGEQHQFPPHRVQMATSTDAAGDRETPIAS